MMKMMKHQFQKNNITSSERIQHFGMLDSGTKDHFMAVQAKVRNINPTINQLNFIIPDGNAMKSTHECEVNWPNLPLQARKHI